MCLTGDRVNRDVRTGLMYNLVIDSMGAAVLRMFLDICGVTLSALNGPDCAK
jgi:hypothetical protein